MIFVNVNGVWDELEASKCLSPQYAGTVEGVAVPLLVIFF